MDDNLIEGVDDTYLYGAAAVLVVVVVGGAFLMMGGGQASTQQPQNQPDTGDTGGDTGGTAPAVEVVSGAAADKVIETSGTDFAQTSAQVSPGAVVKFDNTDSFAHTVTIKAEGIDRQLSGGESITLKFNEGGSYTVTCTIHSGMTTEIGVGQSPDTGGSTGDSGGGGGYDYGY